jgi:hypothetical protein
MAPETLHRGDLRRAEEQRRTRGVVERQTAGLTGVPFERLDQHDADELEPDGLPAGSGVETRPDEPTQRENLQTAARSTAETNPSVRPASRRST